MHQAIEITSTSPDFGSCILHNKQITSINTQNSSIQSKYLCNQCIQINNPHKYESTEQYTRRLVNKLISMQPKQKQQHQSLIRIFEKLHSEALQFQEQLEQTIVILKQINLRKYSVIKCALKFNSDLLYDQLCQWGMMENCSALENVAKEMELMCLDNKLAPQLYKQWAQDIMNSISRLKNYSECLRDEALQMENVLSFSQVIKKMKNEVKLKSEIIKKESVVKVEEVEQKLDIQGQDKTQQQIIDMLETKDISSFTTINLGQFIIIIVDRNGMGQSALQVLLKDKLPKLKKLIISNNLIDEKGLQIILSLKQNLPNLQVLKMEGNFIDKDYTFSLIQNIKQAWPNLSFSI